MKQRIARGNVRYIWTSGRKCNFAGCDRADLQPPNVNGWFWSGSGAKIGPTTQRNTGDWSYTGGYGQPQPDNREAAQVCYNSLYWNWCWLPTLDVTHLTYLFCWYRVTTSPAWRSWTTSTTTASSGTTWPATTWSRSCARTATSCSTSYARATPASAYETLNYIALSPSSTLDGWHCTKPSVYLLLSYLLN